MANYDTFKIWYAKSLANNTFALADATHKIQNVTTPIGEEISLIYLIPQPFAKRTTDVSNALAVDPTSPDTGTGASNIVLRFVQQRTAATRTIPVLPKLLAIFYELMSDDVFQKGRIGIENTDNPELDCLPIATAGYKLLSIKQEPNQNTPGVQIWELVLKFVGDNTKLGTRS
jgi:hypothetical protein